MRGNQPDATRLGKNGGSRISDSHNGRRPVRTVDQAVVRTPGGEGGRERHDSAPHSNRSFGDIVAESLPSAVCVLDADGVICYVNRAWRDSLGRRGGDPRLCNVGANYLDVCGRSAAAGAPEAAQARDGIQQVLAGDREEFRLDYNCDDEGRERWFELRAHRADEVPGRAVIRHIEITERKRLEMTLEHQAHFDPLTGLPNQVHFEKQALARQGASAPGGLPCLCHLGIGDYDTLVHGFGHGVACQVEQAVAQRLRAFAGAEAPIAALGRGRFLVLGEVERKNDAEHFAQGLLAVTKPPVLTEGHEIDLHASVGVALSESGAVDESTIRRLSRSADIAHLRAQRETGGGVRIFDRAMADRRQRIAQAQAGARRALADGRLELHFQPIVGAVARYPAAVETLLRHRLPDGRLESMGPAFVHLERLSAIVEIDRWVIENACRQWVAWQAKHRSRWSLGVITVNASPFHFQQADFVPWLARILEETGMPPGRLALEITERAYVDDEEAFTRSIRGVALLGVSIWVDDFGTGYSSFDLLRKGWASAVKLDRTMAAPQRYDHASAAVIRAVVSLARHLGLRTVAEGVETQHQALRLDQLDCDLQQGFWHARPMAAAALEKWVLGAAPQRPQPALTPPPHPRTVFEV